MSTKLLKVGLMAALLILISTSAFAQSEADSVFGIVINKGFALFREIRTIVFVMGGFGLVGLAVASIFGRPMWKWFAALALGLVVVAVAGAIVTYFAGTNISSNYNGGGFNDTLNKS